MNQCKKTYGMFSVIIITIMLLICTWTFGFNIIDQTIKETQTRAKHIPKKHPRPKSHIKLTADKIWEEYFEIYVQSDPDLPEPGYGSYNFRLVVEAMRIGFSKPVSLIGGMQSVYDNLEYPELLKEMRIGGKIHVMAYVETDSMASSAGIMSYPGKCKFYELETAACEAIKKVKFSPAEIKHKPVSAKMDIFVEFIPKAEVDSTHQLKKDDDNLFFEPPVDPPHPLKGSWEDLRNKAIQKAGKDTKGYVIIRTYIDKSGTVLRARTLEPPIKDSAKNEAAMDVIKNTKFKPALLHGKIPVGVWFNIPVIYKLD